MIKFSKSLTSLNQQFPDEELEKPKDFSVKIVLRSKTQNQNEPAFTKRFSVFQERSCTENDQDSTYIKDHGLYSSVRLNDRKPLGQLNYLQNSTYSNFSAFSNKTALIKKSQDQNKFGSLFLKKNKISSNYAESNLKLSTCEIIHEETSQFQLQPKIKFEFNKNQNSQISLKRAISTKENVNPQKKIPLIQKVQLEKKKSLGLKFSIHSQVNFRRQFETSSTYDQINKQFCKNQANNQKSNHKKTKTDSGQKKRYVQKKFPKHFPSQNTTYRLCINCLSYVNYNLTKQHEKKCNGFQNILKMTHDQLVNYLNDKIQTLLNSLEKIQLSLKLEEIKNQTKLHSQKNKINQILKDLNSIRLRVLKKLNKKV